MKQPIRPTKSFTLIELLVVVAIIALLIALLMPMLDSVRDRAVTIQCLSNMKQQAMGTLLYCGDYDGAFKSATDGVGGNSNCTIPPGDWFTVMNPYVGSDTIWTCPGAPASAGAHCSSLNPLLDLAHPTGWIVGWGVTLQYKKKYVRLNMLPNPSTTGMYFERLSGWAAPDLNQTWWCGGPAPQILPNWNTDYGCWPVHNKTAMQSATFSVASRPNQTWYWPRDTNVARVDGSARTYPWVHLKQGSISLSARPATFTGSPDFPRAYLITGYAPPTIGVTSGASGWLPEY